MLVDKMGQEIVVGCFVIKPWHMHFDLGRVVKVNEHTFVYEEKYTDRYGEQKTRQSICRVPDRCLIVPEIVANYWNILDGV